MQGQPRSVLVVTHYFPAHGGGLEIVAGNVVRRLAESGHRVEWFASATDPAPDWTGVACRPQPAFNWTERTLGVPWPLWSPGSLPRLWRAIGRSDVVHVHDGLYPANFVAALLARRARKRLVVTQHVGQIPYRSVVLRALLALANRVVARAVLGRADAVLFVSPVVREYFAALTPRAGAFVEVPNGLDTALFSPAPPEQSAELRASLGLRADRPLLLFVGRRVEKKGLDLVRELAARTPDCQWCLIGDGPIDPAAWGLGNVRAEGRLPQDAIVAWYRAADVLVLPSVGEGFPLVVQEALGCGLVVAVHTETREAGRLPDAVCVDESVLGDDAAVRWHARLRALLAESEAEREARRIACRAHAVANWSWEATANVYAKILAGP